MGIGISFGRGKNRSANGKKELIVNGVYGSAARDELAVSDVILRVDGVRMRKGVCVQCY